MKQRYLPPRNCVDSDRIVNSKVVCIVVVGRMRQI